MCQTDQDFIREINCFLQNPNRKKYYAEVRQRFMEKYESNKIRDDFESFLKMKLKTEVL